MNESDWSLVKYIVVLKHMSAYCILFAVLYGRIQLVNQMRRWHPLESTCVNKFLVESWELWWAALRL